MLSSPIRIFPLLALLVLSALQPFSHAALSSGYLITPIAGIRDLEGATVYTALQARDGYIWLGSGIGLVRYDGLTPVTYRPSNTPALGSAIIRCLHQARNGDLWIGTNQGAVRHRHDTFESIPGLEDIGIRAFAEDASGAIWIGTHGHGLYSWRDNTLRHHPQQLLAPNTEYIDALHADHADTLWIGSRGASAITLPNASAHSAAKPRSEVQNPANPFAIAPSAAAVGRRITAITEHPRGTYWFGTNSSGLHRLTPDGAITRYTTLHGLETLQISQITPAADGGLWFTSANLHKIPPAELLAPLPPDTRLTTIAPPETQRIIAFAEDHEGSLWLCARTSIGGLLRARAIHHQLINTDKGLPGDNTKTISRDPDGNLWITMLNAGIARLSPDGGITRLPIPPDMENASPRNDPYSVVAASDGSIWTIWQGRVYIWRDNHYTAVPTDSEAYGIHEDTDGIIWISCDKHTERHKNGRRLDTPDDAVLRQIRRGIVFHETPDGALYIASRDYGIYKYHRGTLTTHDTANGLPGNNARAVYLDSRGNLWAGLREHGIATLGEDGRWLHSDALSAALSSKVSAITEDSQGNLWLGTAAGVMWSPIDTLLDSIRTGAPVQDLHSFAIANNIHAAPVWSNQGPVHARLPDGQLLFATRSGILAFDPREAASEATPPPVHIEKIIADGHPIDMRARPVLIPAGTRSLTIEYTGLSYIRPDSITYKYRLDDQAPWQDAGPARNVIFVGIPPGPHQLQVTARTASGAWNPAPATLRFDVAPFIWQTLWFRTALPLALLVAITLATLAIHRARTRRLQRHAADLARQNAELETRVRERTLELTLSNTAKSEFLENISHEIRNPLNGITGLIRQLDDDPAVPLTPAQHDRNRALNASARQLNRVFEEILSFSKLEYGYIIKHETLFSPHALLAEIRDLHAPQAASIGGTIALSLPAVERHYVGDEGKIRTIIDNFVTNALKYAPGTPITITLTVAGIPPDPSDRPDLSEVLIEVADSGPGIPLEEQKLIFKKFARGTAARQSGANGTGLGLATCAATASLLGGKVGVTSQPGQGSTFFLKLSLQPALGNAGFPPGKTAGKAPGTSTPPAARQRPIENRATERSDILPSKIENPTALIVDDQRYNQMVIAGIIDKHDIRPDCAATAAEALAKIEARPGGRPHDIIFLDIELPDMKGTQLARLIRARPGGSVPLLIGVSAHDSDENRTRCLAAGMDDFLLKPVSEDTLIAAVARLRDSDFEMRNAEHSKPAPASGNRQSPDFSTLESIATQHPGGVAAIKRIYIDSLRDALAALREAHAAGDAPALAQTAHRIRSHTMLVGARSLCETARGIEARARRGETEPHIAPLLDEIENHAETLIRQMEGVGEMEIPNPK